MHKKVHTADNTYHKHLASRLTDSGHCALLKFALHSSYQNKTISQIYLTKDVRNAKYVMGSREYVTK